MKRIGVLGGISAQATMDFEARVHRLCQERVPQHWNSGYPPMVVWYHRRLPVRIGDDGKPLVPMQVDPELVEAARWLGKAVDLLVIPCNSAHVGLREITAAAGCPVVSMIAVTLEEVARRGWQRIGVLGFNSAPRVYVDPLRERGIHCEGIDATRQSRLDGAIRAVMEGRDGAADVQAARDAVDTLRAARVDGLVLGCTEIPLLLGREAEKKDLVDPVAALADAAVRLATTSA